MLEKVNVCDVCKDRTKDTVRYRIGRPGTTRQVDLCVDDAAPIEGVLTAVMSRPRPARRRAVTTTMAEVQAVIDEGKPAKKAAPRKRVPVKRAQQAK